MKTIDQIQEKLLLPKTGVLDELTTAAIRNIQLKNNMVATGLVTEELITMLFPDQTDDDGSLDSDLFNPVKINKYLLPKSEYLTSASPKRYIFLHHTAGWDNPYRVVDTWARDRRGPIGTTYVVGGVNISTGDKSHDGAIVECMPPNGYAWHLGIGRTPMHVNSIGIELCNFGWVTKDGYFRNPNSLTDWVPGKGFYTYTGTKISEQHVVDLKLEFRGFRYYHKYTDEQIESIFFLIKKLGSEYGIDYLYGLKTRLQKNKNSFDAFEYSEDIRLGKERSGVFSHTNVIKSGKWDISPQPNLIEMILNL